jgi:predicted enzyme related to lactoylglutathione lyase
MPTSSPAQFVQGSPLLEVPDVLATAEYYRKTLGFRSDAGAASSEYSVVWRDNAAVHLAKGESVPTGVRIFFWVKDVDALHQDVIARGAEIAMPIGTRPYGIRDFGLRDPNGVLLVFGQDWY